ncbi:cobaltochelatase subunit CobN [Synechococcus sp. H70.2]|uniref:cobaltochelatase subunit CobN n=1 Tax=Synechococcus sp. H70.2 TaxID=2964528 RepID=UPI0039C45C7D
MHRIAALPGGWDPSQGGVVFLEQDPAPIVVLSAADTDLTALSAAMRLLPADFPAVRAANLLQLQQPLSIDDYAEKVLRQAQVVLLRLLGGRAYWSYGLEVAKEVAAAAGSTLIVIPGDDRPDWDLVSHSTVPLAVADRVWQYWLEGGAANVAACLKFLAREFLGQEYAVPEPQVLPRLGIYHPPLSPLRDPHAPKVGILLYRAHVLAGNTQPIDALAKALQERGLQPLCLYTYGLQEPDLPQAIREHFGGQIELLLNTTSFSLARLESEQPDVRLWQELDVPVVQVVLSSGSRERWENSTRGLGARDLAMNVVLPEVDGRILSRAISFKTVQQWDPRLQTEIMAYEAVPDRVAFVAELAANWVKLRRTPANQRRLALILANYPSRDGRLANGVGLDTPASCVEILKALAEAGYRACPLPQSGDELIRWLTQGQTYDPLGSLRPARQVLPAALYREWFAQLPAAVQEDLVRQWGDPPAHDLPIVGLQLEQVFVGIQPPRGYDRDPSLNYHAPDLVPPHEYLAFYLWLRQVFGVQAVVHVGKHGNLEWLPGKGSALSATCYPEIALGPLPHFYPFIVNDPGEGSQAKRRAQAVILDHLTPPLTRAELYGPLAELERLMDEYYEAQQMDPGRCPLIRAQIQELVRQEHLDLQFNLEKEEDWTRLDGYLCELKESQIRDGLHIFGRTPTGEQLVDLLLALARYPGAGQLGLTQAIARDWGWDWDPLAADLTDPWPDKPPA